MKKLQLLIADDHAMLRRGVRSVIEANENWNLCAEARNGREAVELARLTQPDIAVMDISMPELNGVDAIRLIKKESPRTKILILSMHDSDSLFDAVREAGAHGFLLKSDAPDVLPNAIAAVANGHSFFSATSPAMQTTRKAGPQLDTRTAHRTRFRLGSRERQIVQLLAEGRSNKEAADQLGISVATVETHRKNIMGKLGLGSIADLVRYAIRNQIVQA